MVKKSYYYSVKIDGRFGAELEGHLGPVEPAAADAPKSKKPSG